MKRSILIRMAALCVGALALSCAQVQEPLPAGSEIADPAGETISFTAVLEQDGTRTSLDGQLHVYWSDGDKIRVFTAGTPAGVEYRLSAGAGTPDGVFTGPAIGAGPYYAVYPADAGVSLAGTSLHVTVPAVQNYAADSFGAGANLAAARGDALEHLVFRNLCGALALKLTGKSSIRTVRVFVPVGQTLNGTAVVSGWDAGAPTLTFDAGQTAESNAEVTLSCGDRGVGLTSAGKTFHVVLPVGALSDGFFVEAVDMDGKGMVRHSGSTPAIARSEVRPMPALAYTPKYKDAFLIAEGAGAFAKATAASSGTCTPLCRYIEGRSQYAYMNTPGTPGTRILRLQDWTDGFALTFTLPYVLSPGGDCSVSLASLGNTGVVSGTGISMRVVKRFGDRVWLCDTQSGNGYVTLMIDEED